MPRESAAGFVYGFQPNPLADDLYVRLGLPLDASPELIQAEYLVLMRVQTPEQDPRGRERIREAYEILGDSSARGAV
jgi:curved DNA-binding protein CbpA